jgi:hypothetical protein
MKKYCGSKQLANKWIGNKIGKNVPTKGLLRRGLSVMKQEQHKMLRNKGGFINLIVGIIMGFMVVTMLVTLLPGFTEMIDTAQGSNYLNCVGYTDNLNDGGNYTYNATVGSKSTIACLGMKLFLPYIVLGVLIALIIKILYDRTATSQNPYG